MVWRKKDERTDENDWYLSNFFNESFINFKKFEEYLRKEMESLKREFMTLENDAGNMRTFGPYYYGRITTIGPDGKPVVKEYGNIDPRTFGFPIGRMIDTVEEQQPLIDTFIEEKSVRVIMELPGVEKDNLKIHATEDKVTIKALKDGKELSAEKELTVKIKPKTARASLKNGVLEIIFDRKEPVENADGFEVKIE